MKFTRSETLGAGREALWQLFMDMPRSASLLPGVESFDRVGKDTWRGTLIVRLGPLGLRLQGRIVREERNRDAWHAAWRAEAEDRRLAGAANGTATMTLVQRSPALTEAMLDFDIHVLGRFGDLGRPIVRRMTDRLLERFFRNVTRELAGSDSGNARLRY